MKCKKCLSKDIIIIEEYLEINFECDKCEEYILMNKEELKDYVIFDN